MAESPRETEVKLAFPSPAEARRALSELGAVEETGRAFEDNVVFERGEGELKRAGRTLRLRRVGDRATLTLKSPVDGTFRHKVRAEDETGVDDPDAVERLLLALGFRTGWRYQKYRTTYRLDGLHVCLDETPLGCFVELEGDGGRIDAAASRLGYSPEAYITESYRALQEIGDRSLGREPGDLLMERGPETKEDAGG